MNEPESTTDRTKFRVPYKTIVWMLFVAVVLAVLHSQAYYFNEEYNMNPAVPWIATLLLGFLTF